MRVYITQNGFWWSASATVWKALVDHVVANDGVYDLDTFPGIKALRGRPSTIRIEDNDSTGRRYFHDTHGHTIHRPLDWTVDDWRSA